MKRILLVIMLAMSICGSVFANNQQVIDEFKTIVQDKVAQIQSTYPPYSLERYVIIKDGKNYHKEMVIFTSEFDIKETDSIVSPYIGILKLRKSEMAFKANKDIEKAKTEMYPDFTMGKDTNIDMIYKYSEGKWVFDDALWFLTKRPLSITEVDAIEMASCPDEYKEPNNHEPISR